MFEKIRTTLSYQSKIVLFFLLIYSGMSSATGKENSKKNITIGVYLSSIYELDINGGSYSADFWIWSESLIKEKFSLNEVELGLLHGKFPVDVSLKYQENLDKNTLFENRKIRGTFLHDFNLDLFPFDRQLLRFYIEGTSSVDEMNFFLSPYSGFNNSILISGWRINKFRLIQKDSAHNTNFGYPKYNLDVRYPLIEAEIELVRNSPNLFLKLSIGLFIAVLIAALSSAMPVNNNDLYGSRVTLLGGALLAAVLNQQFADSKAGGINSITLIDIIHLVGISMIGGLFIAAILFRYLCEIDGWKSKIQKFDAAFGFLILVLFVIISSIIIEFSI